MKTQEEEGAVRVKKERWNDNERAQRESPQTGKEPSWREGKSYQRDCRQEGLYPRDRFLLFGHPLCHGRLQEMLTQISAYGNQCYHHDHEVN